jgi:hypothetical protein
MGLSNTLRLLGKALPVIIANGPANRGGGAAGPGGAEEAQADSAGAGRPGAGRGGRVSFAAPSRRVREGAALRRAVPPPK